MEGDSLHKSELSLAQILKGVNIQGWNFMLSFGNKNQEETGTLILESAYA